MASKMNERLKFKSVEELLGVVNEEAAMDIEIYKISGFKGHPFKVLDDDKMEELVESIKANGVLSPVLIRPKGMDTYEMISGHRRLHAAKLAGLTAIPSIIRDMTDDEAIIAMVDANIQREELLPSEKAFALEMIYNIIDRRYCTRKPLIVTTNLSYQDMTRVDLDIEHQRIYSRLMEMCLPVIYKGSDQRMQEQNLKMEWMKLQKS